MPRPEQRSLGPVEQCGSLKRDASKARLRCAFALRNRHRARNHVTRFASGDHSCGVWIMIAGVSGRRSHRLERPRGSSRSCRWSRYVANCDSSNRPSHSRSADGLTTRISEMSCCRLTMASVIGRATGRGTAKNTTELARVEGSDPSRSGGGSTARRHLVFVLVDDTSGGPLRRLTPSARTPAHPPPGFAPRRRGTDAAGLGSRSSRPPAGASRAAESGCAGWRSPCC